MKSHSRWEETYKFQEKSFLKNQLAFIKNILILTAQPLLRTNENKEKY